MEITKVVKPFIRRGDPILLAIYCIYKKKMKLHKILTLYLEYKCILSYSKLRFIFKELFFSQIAKNNTQAHKTH